MITCTAILPALSLERSSHQDRFTVEATCVVSGAAVSDSNEYQVTTQGEMAWTLFKTSDEACGPVGIYPLGRCANNRGRCN